MPLKRIIILSSVVSGIGLIIFLIGGAYRGIGSVMIFTAIMLWAYRFGLRKLANRFQNEQFRNGNGSMKKHFEEL